MHQDLELIIYNLDKLNQDNLQYHQHHLRQYHHEQVWVISLKFHEILLVDFYNLL